MSDRFSYDVFLSHSSVDDDVARNIAERLTKDGLRVFLDDHAMHSGGISKQVYEAIQRSRNFIVLYSEHASKSSWVASEIDYIVSSTRDALRNQYRRLVVLRLDGTPLPPELSTYLYLPWRPEDRESSYRKALKDCRHKTLRILLAKPEKGLVRHVPYAKQGLDRFGEIEVISAENFAEGDGFNREFEEALSETDLFVQLLGPSAGRREYVDYQAETARQQKNVVVMQWLSSEVDLGTVTNPRHRSVLQADGIIMNTTLPEFVKQVCDHALKLKTPTTSVSGSLRAFINADDSDSEMAKEIGKICRAHRFDTIHPARGGTTEDVREDLEENLTSCEVVIFLYGNAPYTWMRGQLLNYAKLRAKSPKYADKKLTAICVLPPPKQADLGVDLAGRVERIDCVEGWDPERVHTLLKELK